MKTKGSKRFQLDTETLKRLGRTALIMFTPVILIFLDQIQNGTMDWRIIGATAMGIGADAVRRYLTDYSK